MFNCQTSQLGGVGFDVFHICFAVFVGAIAVVFRKTDCCAGAEFGADVGNIGDVKDDERFRLRQYGLQMEVTASGTLMLVSLLQPLNASSPMDVTLSGMLMLVGLLQLLNTSFPMDVTLSGMLILVSLWQS